MTLQVFFGTLQAVHSPSFAGTSVFRGPPASRTFVSGWQKAPGGAVRLGVSDLYQSSFGLREERINFQSAARGLPTACHNRTLGEDVLTL